jgi:hypothetical protein
MRGADMADDTQPPRGLVLPDEWHVSVRVEDSTALEEANELRTRIDASLFSWCADLLALLRAGIEVGIDN